MPWWQVGLGGGRSISIAALSVNIDARWKWAVKVFGFFAPGKEERYRPNSGLGGAQQPGWSHFELRQSRLVGILTLVRPGQSLVAMLIIITRPLICIVKVKKVKCTLVQALRLCTGRTAHRGSKGIALFFLDHGNRRGWGVSVTPRPLFTPGKDQVPILQEAGWAPGPVGTGAENLGPTGIRSPDRPACSQSVYRLSYPARNMDCSVSKICFVRKKSLR